MQSRVWGERAAKAGIYIVFSLAVFAFFMFFHSAEEYRAAAVVAVPQAQRAEVSAASSAPRAPDTAAAVTDSLTGETAPDNSFDSGKKEELLNDNAQPEVLAATEPHVYGKEVDSAALNGELARIAAMGFGLPADASANYVGNFYATSYCCEAYPHICGGNGVTASGTVPTPGLTVAADWNVLPPGTWLYIGGVGIRRVEDSGSAIRSARLDVAVDTHANALAWGGQGNHDVWIVA